MSARKYVRGPAHVRFNAYVNKSQGCWEWTAALTDVGYGMFNFSAKEKIGAHVYAWEAAHGMKVPQGKVIAHHCDNRKCVNPSHLYAATRRQNTGDMIRRGRNIKDGTPVTATLTKGQVLEIRDRHNEGETQTALAKEFSVSQSAISNVVHGKTWSHLDAQMVNSMRQGGG